VLVEELQIARNLSAQALQVAAWAN
jgi:hypothetical protein